MSWSRYGQTALIVLSSQEGLHSELVTAAADAGCLLPREASFFALRASRSLCSAVRKDIDAKGHLCEFVGCCCCRWMDPDEGEEDIEAIAEERLEKGPQPAAV